MASTPRATFSETSTRAETGTVEVSRKVVPAPWSSASWPTAATTLIRVRASTSFSYLAWMRQKAVWAERLPELWGFEPEALAWRTSMASSDPKNIRRKEEWALMSLLIIAW